MFSTNTEEPFCSSVVLKTIFLRISFSSAAPGGADFHSPYTSDNSDEGNYVQAEKAGYTIARGYDDYKAKAAGSDKMLLLEKNPNSDHYLSYAIDRKEGELSLADITEAAIDFMMKDPKKGFFMMMEGGRIDQACHSNDPGAYVQEMFDFDKAIARLLIKFP